MLAGTSEVALGPFSRPCPVSRDSGREGHVPLPQVAWPGAARPLLAEEQPGPGPAASPTRWDVGGEGEPHWPFHLTVWETQCSLAIWPPFLV